MKRHECNPLRIKDKITRNDSYICLCSLDFRSKAMQANYSLVAQDLAKTWRQDEFANQREAVVWTCVMPLSYGALWEGKKCRQADMFELLSQVCSTHVQASIIKFHLGSKCTKNQTIDIPLQSHVSFPASLAPCRQSWIGLPVHPQRGQTMIHLRVSTGQFVVVVSLNLGI